MSEKTPQQIFEKTKEAITLENLNNSIICTNPMNRKVSRQWIDALLKDPRAFLEMVHLGDMDRIAKIFVHETSTDTSGEKYRVKYRIAQSDGEIRWLDIKVFSLFDQVTELSRIAVIIEDITKIKQTEEKLLQSRIEWEAFFQAIGYPTVILDKDQNILEANHAALQVTGLSKKILKTKKCFEVFHLSKQSSDVCPLEKMLRSKQFEMVEMEIDALNSIFLVSCTPIVDKNGEIQKIIHIATDIMERKETEEALIQSEENYRVLAENTTDLISVFSTDGTVEFASEASRSLCGFTPSEIIGTSKCQHVHPDDQDKVLAAMDKLLKTNEDCRLEYRIQCKDGQYKWVESASRIFHIAQTGEAKIICVTRDINERKKAEEALIISEQQYRALVQNVNIGIGIIQNEKFVFTNQALRSIVNYKPNQGNEMLLTEVFPADISSYFKKYLSQIERGTIKKTGWKVVEIPMSPGQAELWMECRHCFIIWEDKPAILLTLRDITERKLRDKKIESEKVQLQEEIKQLRVFMKDSYRFGKILGKSPVMQEVYELILKASTSNAPVVIYGESGTGKDLVAQTIHQLSKRQKNAFVPVNCGSIPETLMESEFFGHSKGAFTGAHKEKAGLFEAAQKGTLFLDEIGEMSLSIQIKLLRAIEGKGYIPVGSHIVKYADVRIVAATNKNLMDLVREGKMRKDFFYRLHVMTINIPPLRDRKEDIPLLIDHFLEQQGSSLQFRNLPKSVVDALVNYKWPGNIRELQNALHQYTTFQQIDFFDTTDEEPFDIGPLYSEIEKDDSNFQKAVETLEKRLILHSLEQNQWQRTKTAMMLGLPRKTLFRKMKKYGLE
ncbi:MAG: sigma 54-interacting transcriptional regulator [bacterium]